MKALVLDCDGVLADTERDGHRPAFNQTFRELGVPLEWSEEEYGAKLRISGGKERMASALTPELVARAGLPTEPEEQKRLVAAWHQRKGEIFGEMVRAGRLPGRPGVRRLVREAAAGGWKLAVASTSAEESVRQVLEHVVGRDLAARFAVLAGDVVLRKKPAPDIYLLAVQAVAVPPDRCLAIEDSRTGLLAARAAGLRCIVTQSSYTRSDDFAEALLVSSDLGEPGAPMRILANRSRARPGEYLTARDLEACLSS